MSKYLWRGFSDVELSMIASALAGGHPLCCREHALERATITDSRRKRTVISDEMYERCGCTPWDPQWQAGRTPEYIASEIAFWTDYYLGKFLDTV